MCIVSKRLSCFLNDAVDVVDGKSTPQHIFFRNKDYIGLVQCVIRITRICQVCIQQTAVVSRPLGTSPMVVALHLDIIGMVFLIHCQNIQPHRTTLQILQIMLTMDFLYSQVITVQNDLKQAFRTGLIFKDLAHKVIIHEPEVSDTL